MIFLKSKLTLKLNKMSAEKFILDIHKYIKNLPFA